MKTLRARQATLLQLSPAQVPALSPLQVPVVSPGQVPELIPQQAIALSPSLVPDLSGLQIPVAQVLLTSSAQVPFLVPAQLAALSPAQVPSVDFVQLPVLVPAQFYALSAWQVPGLLPGQVEFLSSSWFPALSPAQIPTLNGGQVGAFIGLSQGQIPAVSPVQVPAVFGTELGSYDKVSNLSPAQVPAASGSQIGNSDGFFTPSQVPDFSPVQVPAVSSSQVGALSPAQVPAISSGQVSSLTPQQIAAQQIPSTPPAQVPLLNPAQIAFVSPSQVPDLSPVQVPELGLKTLTILPSKPATLSITHTHRQTLSLTKSISLSIKLTATRTSSHRPTKTETISRNLSPSSSVTDHRSFTVSPSKSNTPTLTETPSSMRTPTRSVSNSISVSLGPTDTRTPSLQTTKTPTTSRTISLSKNQTSTLTHTSSSSPASSSISASAMPTRTSTSSHQATRTSTTTQVSSRTISYTQRPTATTSITDMPTRTVTISPVAPKAILDLSDVSNTNVLRVSGPNDGYLTSYFVNNIGDINGDGRDETLLSTRKVSMSSTEEGLSCICESYVVFGQEDASNFPTNLLALTATQGFKITNIPGFVSGRQQDGSWSGWCQVMGVPAGDINLDGLNDFILANSKTQSADNGLNVGAAWAIFVKAGGYGNVLDLASIALPDGFQIMSSSNLLYMCLGVMHISPQNCKGSSRVIYTETNLGAAICATGDVDGDKRPDIVVSNPLQAREVSTGYLLGSTHIISGNSSFTSVFDVSAPANSKTVYRTYVRATTIDSSCDLNGDSYADIVSNSPNALAVVNYGRANFSSINPAADIRIIGAAGGDGMLVQTGDLDGNGKCDIVISLPAQQPGSVGSIYVVLNYGALPSVVNVSDFDGRVWRADGQEPGKNFAVSFALCDVNGDGKLDSIVAEADLECMSSSVYVLLSTEDFVSARDVKSLNGWNGYKIINVPGCWPQGLTVSCGNIDGKGNDDILIGTDAPGEGALAYFILS